LMVVVDPVGDVIIAQEQAEVEMATGTSVSVPLPLEVHLDVETWAYKTALVNPHATITVIYRANGTSAGDPEIYKPHGGRWSKWTPSQPSNPHWYDPAAFSALVHSHIRETARTGVDMPLGKFISEFDGLSGSAKQKQIRALIPGITHLSGLEGRSEAISALYDAMLAEAKPSSPARLGAVGKEHLERLLDDRFGVHRFWYKAATVVDAGVPWVIEVAAADTEVPGGYWFGCNHSPAFDDPLGRTPLRRTGYFRSTGSASFLSAAGVDEDSHTAVVHVICAATQFVDKGKVALVVPDAVAQVAAEALESASKVLHREEEQRRKDASKAAKAVQRARETAARAERAAEWTQKDAVFTVMKEAKDSAGAVCSARTLYYKVRPLIQKYTDKPLQYGYFSQTLLPEYERTVGPLRGLYYDARGYLHHPHDGKKIPLGTREVESYQLPRWEFDKVLYIEKEGLDAQLEPYRLGQRNDMAIIYGKGEPVVACRNLLARADIREMTIFVAHDADPGGYSIARTLAEATRRMPDHNIEVVDLGLTVPQAIEYGLETEQFTRQKALPVDIDLDPQSLAWFTGEPFYAANGKTHYRARRCELNAFSSDELADFIETGVQQHCETVKLVPPNLELAAHTHYAVRSIIKDAVIAELKSRVDLDAVAATLASRVDVTGLVTEAAIREKFTDNPEWSWSGAANWYIAGAVGAADLGDAIASAITDQLGGDQ
jgi:hypothetical protein